MENPARTSFKPELVISWSLWIYMVGQFAQLAGLTNQQAYNVSDSGLGCFQIFLLYLSRNYQMTAAVIYFSIAEFVSSVTE